MVVHCMGVVGANDVRTKLRASHSFDDCSASIWELYHVLIVDDDDEILHILAEFLKINGYIVSTLSFTSAIDDMLSEFEFDIMIMDVMMEGEDGLSYLKRMRDKLKMPVMMLTALGDVDYRIHGLETGADDYLVKPFDPRELLLRMEKLLRRKKHANNENDEQYPLFTKKQYAVFGNFTFDINKGTLMCVGNPVHLTNSESRLLAVLAKCSGNIVHRDAIIKMLREIRHNDNSIVNTDDDALYMGARSVDTQIARLRNKIEKNPKYPEFLQAIRGVGYVLWATVI